MNRWLPVVGIAVGFLTSCAGSQEPAPGLPPQIEREPAAGGEAVAEPAPEAPAEEMDMAMAADEAPMAPPPPARRHRAEKKKMSMARPSPKPARAPAPAPTPTPSGDTLPPGHDTEAYDRIYENPFLLTGQNPLSTFSIDVDTASYANMRRFLRQGQLPPKGALRIEELINYFRYAYPKPMSTAPFSVSVEIADCPWNDNHRLARIGLKGREIDRGQRSASNIVFLLDVSGSMNNPNKLPLLKQAMKMLVNNLNQRDRVAVVVYAGASGVVLPSTSAARGNTILETLDNLRAGGSTNAGQGIELAYKIAEENFIKKGINRVILATDGDFNVGVTNQSDLIRLIEEKAKKGVFLTVLGFGMGNYKDSTLEKLADKGNGNYGYIDDEKEARKVLVEELGGTLVTIAKDVKIQVEFNPARVGAYRLIGYENRMLRAEDFKDDTKDAGEIGAGHTVTALYELVPPDEVDEMRKSDALKYSKPAAASGQSKELMTVKLRYKKPDEDESRPLEFPITDPGTKLAKASPDFKFAAAVAGFGMLLRDSEHKGSASFASVRKLAKKGASNDPGGYRKEFLELIDAAEKLEK